MEIEIAVERDGEYVKVQPRDLTTAELCLKLKEIVLDSDEFVSRQEIEEGYAAIGEAIRRLEV